MEKLTPSATVVIPTLTNTKGLFTLINQLSPSQPIVVVDNQPTEKKRELTKRNNITYLPQESNAGFARAINIGAKEVKTPWMIIANDDIELPTANIVQELTDFGSLHLHAAVSPILKNPQGKVENLGYTVLPKAKAKLNFDPDKTSQEQLDGLTAAFLLINTSVFSALGGFDEFLFAYQEDIDLFLRLKEAGYTFAVAPDTTVIHHHNQTSKKMPLRKAWLDLRNWAYLIVKHWGHPFQVKHIPSIITERLRNASGVIKTIISSGSA